MITDTELDEFQRRGTFPHAHDKLFDRVQKDAYELKSVCDLGCGNGLLGMRIVRMLGLPCIGIEAESMLIQRARAAGVTMTIKQLRVDLNTLDLFTDMLAAFEVDTIVCRRALGEIIAAPQPAIASNKRRDPTNFPSMFVQAIYNAGVEHVYLQGKESQSPDAERQAVSEESIILLPYFHALDIGPGIAHLRRANETETASKARPNPMPPLSEVSATQAPPTIERGKAKKPT